MRTSIRELKDHLSELVRRAQRGEEIIVTSHNKPVVKLVPVSEEERDVDAARTALVAELRALRADLASSVKGEPLSETVIRGRKTERY